MAELVDATDSKSVSSRSAGSSPALGTTLTFHFVYISLIYLGVNDSIKL